MNYHEVNFDGLIGPTHNYAGLSFGNIASQQQAGLCSNPRQAALQGLAKIKMLMDFGLPQAILPPHERPHLPTLRSLGFTGSSEARILRSAQKQAPHLLAACCSASAMWAANAATVSPAADCIDGRTNFTPANLISMFHRSIEAPQTARVLQRIFNNPDHYSHHQPLPCHRYFGDEGAANHTRLCADYGEPGVELFIHGTSASQTMDAPRHYPARQSMEACKAIVRAHGLKKAHYVIGQQHPAVIDKGVFHNDVISVGNLNLLFYHQQAYVNSKLLVAELREKMAPVELLTLEVPASKVSVEDAVKSYLFNSQLIKLQGENGQRLIAPSECCETEPVKQFLDEVVAEQSVLSHIHFTNLRQSMSNGGGPACLRLRVVMSDEQIETTNARVFLDEKLYEILTNWIERHYRDCLMPQELADPQLHDESRQALDELTCILDLGSIYEFQREKLQI